MPTQRLIKHYVIVLDASARGSPGPTTLSGCGVYAVEGYIMAAALGANNLPA